MKTLLLAGGCFWGMEELFRTQPGVIDTEVGYAGGDNDTPTYEYHPGHAEALEITYDESVTNAAALLDYFYQIHDPTTMNRQGNDVGSSYRSAIFYTTAEEKAEAEAAIVRNQIYWQSPIVTKLEKLTTFWPAEEYHQDYLQKNVGGYTCHYERSR
ncbi:MAG: peptide-methionine (S)-S-oxide reductase MsrA [Candidatus Saccharimonadota bacterium]|jgi:peptide-methionine (S)-S-oxide reductase